MAGIGMVIRNSSGQVIGALSDKINLPPIVDDVKAIACRKAISFALDLGVDEVCKVEFNQPFCWLYSVYLGGFVVRVVSEIEC